MTRADDVSSLTRDILASYEARMNALGQLVADTHTMLSDTHTMLKDFRSDHAEMSTRLNEDLTEFGRSLDTGGEERMGQARADLKQRQAEASQIVNQVRELLGDLQSAHAEMSTRLKEDLAEFGRSLDTGDEERMEQARTDLKQRQAEASQRINQVRESLGDLRSVLKDLRSEHTEMSTRLKEDLTEFGRSLDTGEEERMEQARADLKQRQAEASQIVNQVRELLSDLHSAHAEMSTRLKEDLARVTSNLTETDAERTKVAQVDTGERAAGIKERVATIKEKLAVVSDLLGDFKAEREKTATAWQQLGNIMQARRGMAAPESKSPETPPAEEGPAAAPEPADTAPETSSLTERTLAYLTNYPDGARMTELEAEFGVARIQMAKTLRKLMDEEKVEKRDMAYFTL